MKELARETSDDGISEQIVQESTVLEKTLDEHGMLYCHIWNQIIGGIGLALGEPKMAAMSFQLLQAALLPIIVRKTEPSKEHST